MIFSQGLTSQSSFGGVVGEAHAPILKEQGEARPSFQNVVECFGQIMPTREFDDLLAHVDMKDGFLGKQTYVLADGSTVPSQQFRIHSLKVGNKTVENVVHRKWSSDCQIGALDHKATLPFRNAGHAHTIPNTFAPSSVRWMVAQPPHAADRKRGI
jgi:hypothetical protein